MPSDGWLDSRVGEHAADGGGAAAGLEPAQAAIEELADAEVAEPLSPALCVRPQGLEP